MATTEGGAMASSHGIEAEDFKKAVAAVIKPAMDELWRGARVTLQLERGQLCMRVERPAPGNLSAEVRKDPDATIYMADVRDQEKT
jgi:hypothetical protein